MKDLDKECIELNKELVDLENAYIDSQTIIRKRKFDAPDESANDRIEAEHKSVEYYTERINSLRSLTRQKLTEKTAIAVNMGNIIERFSRKLDTDLAFFETDLKGCGEFETPKGAEPGSEVSVLIVSPFPPSPVYSKFSPLLQVAFSITPDVPVLPPPPVLHRSHSLSSVNGALSSTVSCFGGSNPLDLVAMADSVADKSMILGRVICYHADTGAYDILDVDDSKKYLLPERQVIVLDLIESQRRLSKGELVFALYPDTTSFYPAVVSSAPRRTAMGTEPSVIVQFCGDEDANG